MRPNEAQRSKRLAEAIVRYQEKQGALPGLSTPARLDVIVAQLIDSLRRIDYAHYIRDADHDPARMDPGSHLFDPLRAAVLRNRRGETDEAWWLVFLGTHFGKHRLDGWRLARDVYGRLGQGGRWDWAAVASPQSQFHKWLAANETTLRGGDGIKRRFSNHRKYESLKTSSTKGTSSIVASYVAWVAPPRTHGSLIRELHQTVGQDPQIVFATLYESMSAVSRFGRLGKFDFLAMLGKLGIAPIEPGSTFLKGATGPLAGARLLFGGAPDATLSAIDLDDRLIEFGREIGVGAQVLEDGLCNWQKSPDAYQYFRG